ncbi:MAG: glycosyltransferase family 2 protein [Elusimicrobia bacterium]|nr:glycosyltransferase family 2 protein [Elusimicrobiota bacterium]
MGHATLSLLITNFNHGHYLRETLGTVFSQSRPAQEVLVLDDGSTDDSVRILEDIAKSQPTLRLLRNDRNRGVVYSTSRLLDTASCDYVHVLSADDNLLRPFFEKSLAMLERYPRAAVCTALSMFMDEDGKDLDIFPTPVVSEQPCFLPPAEALASLRKHGNWISVYSVISKREVVQALRADDPTVIPSNDGPWLQIMAAQHGICFIPEPLTVWRQSFKGHAYTSSRDFQASVENIDRYDRLLRTRFSRVFPSDYVDQWKRGCLSGMVFGRFKSEPGRHDQLASLMERIPRGMRTIPDRLFLIALRGIAALIWLSVKLYLFLELPAAEQWRTIGRKLRDILPRRPGTGPK